MSSATPLRGSSPTPLRRRLERYYRISVRDGKRLDELEHREIRLNRQEDILERGTRNDSFIVLQRGWACRYRATRDNKRQILNFLVPGDIVNPDSVAVSRADHGIRSISEVTYRRIEKEPMGKMLRECPSVIAALWWSNAQEKGMLQAQIVRLGRQRAIQRVGSLVLELHRRLSLIQDGDESSDRFVLPLTQTDIGDALGLSSVHVSRVLTELRKRRLLRRDAMSVQLLKPQELAELCDFDVDYLHLDSNLKDSFWKDGA